MRFLIPALFFLSSCATAPAGGLERIETIVVIYAENRSFDHLYGLFPGANGIAEATDEQKTQLDHDGTALPHLPPVFTPQGKPDERFPPQLPNGPFRIDAPPINRHWDELLPSPVHAYYQNREQINGGRNNRYVAMSSAGAFVMGYFDGSRMKLWKWAQDYTLADHFFMAAYGGSYLNHLWLVCACTPRYPDAPASMRARADERGVVLRRPDSPKSVLRGPVQVFDGAVSPDGYSVNTVQPPYQPSGIAPAAGGSLDFADPSRYPLPPQKERTIGDTLSAKAVSWAWYAGGWNAATADENGGYWDPAPPPSGPGWSDRWGPGTRVPALIVSPFAKRGFVDKSIYDTTSVLKLVQRRFGLEPLPGVRANVGDLTNAFAF